MLLRICLALAILAGIGVIVVSQFVLKPQIEGIRDERDKNKKEWDKAAALAAKRGKELDSTKSKLEATQKDLDTTKADLAAANAKASSETSRANGLHRDLESTRA